MAIATPARCVTDPWKSFPARIARIRPEVPGVATFELVFEDAAVQRDFVFLPGQFNMLYVPGVGESAISISGDPVDRSCVPHTVREAGNVTHALSRLRPGATIGVRGPFGSSWPLEECRGCDVVVVAGGIGLAPLRPAVHELLRREGDGTLTLLYGARVPSGLLYRDQFDQWRAQGCDVRLTVDRAEPGWSGEVGVVTLLLDRLPIPRPERTVLLTCGPEVMMWYTVQSALRRGIAVERIYVSLERNMNCAVGLCGHCQLGPEFICKDGPVLRFDRVSPFLKVHDL
ncbi:MAG: Ni/Fe hydrogenase subunit gamma [Planctomycetota bacterium]|nr:MAG: Ni/Fe hydrogenase subunit gamma [Planctomycetota bacterium]